MVKFNIRPTPDLNVVRCHRGTIFIAEVTFNRGLLLIEGGVLTPDEANEAQNYFTAQSNAMARIPSSPATSSTPPIQVQPAKKRWSFILEESDPGTWSIYIIDSAEQKSEVLATFKTYGAAVNLHLILNKSSV